MPPSAETVVVKLGGSHALAPHLRPWLHAIEAAAGRVVLVPGGGPFADAVRAAQPAMGFDDAAAHDMALLAMAQYGRALVALTSRLVLADTEADIAAALVTALVPVWSPMAMLRNADIAESWAVTSDSLALFLAIRLQAPCTMLVKHRAAADDADAAALAADGLVDAAFPQFRRRYPGTVRILGPADHAGLA